MKREAQTGESVFYLKIEADILRSNDGKFYVTSDIYMPNGKVEEWSSEPFETETKARKYLEWLFAMPDTD